MVSEATPSREARRDAGGESGGAERLPAFPGDRKPLLAEDVLLYREVEGTLRVVCPAAGKTFELNETAATVLSFCDGTRSIDEIVRAVHAAFRVDEETARDDVSRLVRDLYGSQVIVIGPRCKDGGMS